MKPNLLFLDVDGVLNNSASLQLEPKFAEFEEATFIGQFDPSCIEQINLFVKQASCDVVLSSAWRLGYPLEVTNRYLRKAGLAFDLLDKTPNPFRVEDGFNPMRCSYRGEEIEAWRVANGDRRPFVIVDDDGDMEPFKDRLVQTEFEFGMRDVDVKRALELLGL